MKYYAVLMMLARESSKLLRQDGSLFIVHKPFRIPEIFTNLIKYGLEPKHMRMVHPTVDKLPSMVLIKAILGGKPGLMVKAPLIIYESKNVYSREMAEDYGF